MFEILSGIFLGASYGQLPCFIGKSENHLQLENFA